jgi:lipoprotein-anchoring transpeptidase ErfK/SrfK
VLKANDSLRRYPVAVGTAKYPTLTGRFNIHRIDCNPDWTPPDSEWTEGKEYTPPGHPDNPMVQVRIVNQDAVHNPWYEKFQSLNEAEFHGSVRMTNRDVIELARLIMTESGTEKPADWCSRVLADSTKMVCVDMQQQVPLNK